LESPAAPSPALRRRLAETNLILFVLLICFELVTRHRLLAKSCDENRYVINHNSVRILDCDFIRANSRYISGDCHRFDLSPISKCNRSDA